MRHASLFNGIGGFQLAAAWMGWENVMSCEIDDWCNKVTKYHFPDCLQHGDIKQTDFTIYRGKIDILTGGFPCQPFSVAGQQLGKEDDRYLFPELKRAIRECQPSVIVLENVAGLISILEPARIADLESQAVQFYNREHLLFKVEPKKRTKIELTLKVVQERVVAEVIKEIEAEGYILPRTKKGEPIILCIPAAAVNAPHGRDRIWFVAYSSDARTETMCRQKINTYKPNVASNPKSRFGRSICRHEAHQRGESQKYNEHSNDGNSGSSSHADNYGSHGTENGQSMGKRNDGNAPGAIETGEPERYTVSSSGIAANPACVGQRCESDWYREPRQPNEESQRDDWQNFPTQSPVCSGDDGFPGGLDGITFSKWRQESIKAYGNAIVPQVAYEIFKAIELSLISAPP